MYNIYINTYIHNCKKKKVKLIINYIFFYMYMYNIYINTYMYIIVKKKGKINN